MRADKPDSTILIGLVGPCASGKTTLAARLKSHGWNVRHIAQEHSYVKDMWKRITNPDVLVFLDASYPVTLQRRRLNWDEADWVEQHRRLAHARSNAHLYVETDNLTSEQVFEKVVEFLETL